MFCKQELLVHVKRRVDFQESGTDPNAWVLNVMQQLKVGHFRLDYLQFKQAYIYSKRAALKCVPMSLRLAVLPNRFKALIVLVGGLEEQKCQPIS